MAIPNILVDTTFTGKNISTAISVYEYTVAETGTLRVQVRLAAVAGNGDYVCYLTLNDGDAQTDDPILPKTTATAASGETAFWFASISLDAIAGDVINIFVLGLAGDTSESGSVRIFSDAALQPTVAGRTLDVSSGGEAGIDWANVGAPTTAVNLSGTNIDTDQVVASVSGAVGSLATQAKTDVENAVWNATAASHTGAGTSGLMLMDIDSDTTLNYAVGQATLGRLPAALTADGNIKADALKLNGATPNNLTSAQTASAVLDATASSYNTSGTIGAKINSAAAGSGSGASSYTTTIKDANGNTLDGVEVWITSDLAGNTVVASGTTDGVGVVTFQLDPATYYVWCQLAGQNFTNPTTIVVS